VPFLIASFFSLALLLGLPGCSKPRAPHQAEKTIVGTQRVEPLAGAGLTESAPEYIGTVRAGEETDFSFKVGGIVESIGPKPQRDWEEGSPVKAGSILARLQQGDFKNSLASAKATAELANTNNERLRKLLADKVVSNQEADKAKADSDTASAQLKQAEQNLRDSQLLAPWDGVVFKRYVNSGETVAAAKPVLRFGDIRTMSVELGVPDRLVGLFAVNKEIDVGISALPGRPSFRGKISEVGVAASNAGRLYRVVIKVANPEGVIKSGMTATVKAGSVTAAVVGQVLVPLSAVIAPSLPGVADRKPQTQIAVFVVKEGKASLRPVKTGDIIASSIVVTEGLTPGEEVVTKGASLLYDGAPVEVR
jgi:multidrug efflux system membrane fusion protein